MQSFDLESASAVLLALLIVFGKVVPALFATARVCVREYYRFKIWFRAIRRHANEPEL